MADNEAINPDDLTEIRAELAGLERLARGRRRHAQGKGARERILKYLRNRVGKPVYGEELREISSIQEWARRVRELRVEFGYNIVEEAGTYTLLSEEPDPEAAARWSTANEIRRRPGDARSRIAAFFEANVGRVVSLSELEYVGKISEVARRIRELRDEAGYAISSHNDRSGLRPGEYVLEELPERDRVRKP